MTKENREKLSKHYRKLGVDNPYKNEIKILNPLPPIKTKEKKPAEKKPAEEKAEEEKAAEDKPKPEGDSN